MQAKMTKMINDTNRDKKCITIFWPFFFPKKQTSQKNPHFQYKCGSTKWTQAVKDLQINLGHT